MEKDLKYILSKPVSYYTGAIKKNNKKFDFNKPVVLFGASKLGIIYYQLSTNNNISVSAYCDNDKAKINTTLNGLKVFSINQLKKQYDKNTQIIISSKYDDEIKSQLIKTGFTHIWSHMYFSTIYANRFSILSWNNNINVIVRNKTNLANCIKLLNDNKSKQTLINIVKFRLTLNKKYLKIAKDKEVEYFDSSIMKLSTNEYFIDGGAYSGDTLKRFIKYTNNKFETIHCFEPDTKSINGLKHYVDKELKDNRIEIHKKGLGSKKATVNFSNEGNLQSKIIKDGKTKINVVTLDSFNWIKTTFIKLDIEGYEKEALKGAKNVIKNHKPTLAICSYHYTQDLWEIPLLINKLNKDYKIYLRHYGSYLFDTICYAK